MEDRNKKDQKDLKQLLDQVILAETTQVVFKEFDCALEELDPASRQLLEQYFDGHSIEYLSERKGLSKKEIQDWLNQSRRKLIRKLRQKYQVRQ